MSAGTAAEIVEKALRLLNLLDEEESPTAAQLAVGTDALSALLRHTLSPAGLGFQIEILWYVLPAHQYGFTIGPADTFNVNRDAKHVRTIRAGAWDSVQNKYLTQRELVMSSLSHLHQVELSGDTPIRADYREQVDGSLLVELWPSPASVDLPLQLEISKRIPALSSPSDIVQVPPDAKFQLRYLLAKVLRSHYGVALADVADVMTTADIYEAQWKAQARQDKFVRLRRRPV